MTAPDLCPSCGRPYPRHGFTPPTLDQAKLIKDAHPECDGFTYRRAFVLDPTRPREAEPMFSMGKREPVAFNMGAPHTVTVLFRAPCMDLSLPAVFNPADVLWEPLDCPARIVHPSNLPGLRAKLIALPGYESDSKKRYPGEWTQEYVESMVTEWIRVKENGEKSTIKIEAEVD